MQIDFCITVQHANASTPMMSFTKTSDWYSPDCDFTTVPVPTGGALEGESGYACTGGGDCHLIVIHDTQHKLYEMWRADITGGTFNGGCLAVWDLTKDYVPHGRGEGCTSADAGGFPMAALLFTPTRSPPARSTTPSASSCPTIASARAATCIRRRT